MFGGTRKGYNELSNADIETVIGKNTQVKGTVSGTSNIRIDGKIEGDITMQGDIVIGEQGEVIANIRAKNVLISGTVKGNVEAEGKLEIMATGKLCGDVKAAVLSIAEGAIFKGSSHMESNESLNKQNADPGQKKK